MRFCAAEAALADFLFDAERVTATSVASWVSTGRLRVALAAWGSLRFGPVSCAVGWHKRFRAALAAHLVRAVGCARGTGRFFAECGASVPTVCARPRKAYLS